MNKGLWIGIDTLTMTALGGDFDDVCQEYVSEHAEDDLYNGAVRDNDLLVRKGLHGYNIQISRGDMSVHLSFRNEQGAWIEMGTKSIMAAGDDLAGYVRGFLREVGLPGSDTVRLRLGRVDLAIDLDMDKVPDKHDLIANWVGRSKVVYKEFGVAELKDNQYKFRTQTFYIGSPKSAVQLRMYNKVDDAVHDGDLDYWREVWGNHEDDVTRIEWQVRVRDGNFKREDGRDLELEDLDREQITKFLNYLSWDWGRFVLPSDTDDNRSRWSQPVEFWGDVLQVVKDYSEGDDGRAVRIHPEMTISVSIHAARQYVGMTENMLAKLSLIQGEDFNDISLARVLVYLDKLSGRKVSSDRVKKKVDRLRLTQSYKLSEDYKRRCTVCQEEYRAGESWNFADLCPLCEDKLRGYLRGD